MRKHVLRRSLLSAAATVTILGALAVPSGPAFAAGTGTVTGHLTDSSGQPLANAAVQVYSDQSAADTTTDATGAYTVSGLDAGRYGVSFVPAGANFRQYNHGKRTPETADLVTVAAGATVVVDDRALPSGRIAGSLHARDGSPVRSAYLTAYNGDEQVMAGVTTTAPDGTFAFELLPGQYKIQFYSHPLVYQWNGGAFTYEDAAPVTVTAGQTTPLAETVIATGAIAGQLLRADGTPAAGVGVNASAPDGGGGFHNTTTGADGRYRLDDVPVRAGWLVEFATPGIPQYAHGKLSAATADRITVTEGQTSTVDDQLLPTGTVRITAHDATTGAPLTGFCAWEHSTSFGGCAETTEVVLPGVYAGTWYFDVMPTERQHFTADRQAVTVTAGQTGTIDVALRLGATITVPMQARAGGAAAGGCVQLGRVGAAFPAASACSGEGTGPIVAGPLEPGAYQVFADPGDDALGAQWVGATGGTGDRDAAAQYTVAAGDELTIPAVQLDRAGSIRGTVTDLATGAPVRFACVGVVARAPGFSGDECGAGTAADGTYTITGLGPYAWPVRFTHDAYQWRWSGNAVARPEAAKVTVRAGRSVAANIKLRTGGGTVAGLMRTAAGQPEEGMVVAYNAVTGEAVSLGAQAAPDGRYSLALLAPGQQVKLRWTGRYGGEGWVGGTDFASATPYQVKNAKTTTVNVTVP